MNGSFSLMDAAYDSTHSFRLPRCQAAECDALGMTELAETVRAKSMPRLRKGHLFELARRWRLRSNIWRPRFGAHAAVRSTKRKAQQSADAPPEALAAQSISTAAAGGAAGSAWNERLSGPAASAGPGSLQLAFSNPGASLRLSPVIDVRACVRVTAMLAPLLLSMLSM